VVSRSWITRIGPSPKRRSAGSISSPSKGARWRSARRGPARSGPQARHVRAGTVRHGPPDPAEAVLAVSPRAQAAGRPGRRTRSRNFGPDAPPKNKRKAPRKDGDRGPKGPIKERPVSRLYENDEDWRNDKPEEDIDDIATSAKADPEGDQDDE